MSIDFWLEPNSADANRPAADALRRLVNEEMPGRAQKAWKRGEGYQGAEVDVEPDRISFHMHGSQMEEERGACFELMERLAGRLGWTLFGPDGDPIPIKVRTSKSAAKPISATRYRHRTLGDATLIRRQDNGLRLRFDDGTERVVQERFLTPLDG